MSNCSPIYIPTSNCEDCSAFLSRIQALESAVESMTRTVATLQESLNNLTETVNTMQTTLEGFVKWDEVSLVPISITSEEGTTETAFVLTGEPDYAVVGTAIVDEDVTG